MIILKQSTAATLRVGCAVAVGDGVTPVTTLTLSGADEAELLKHTGGVVDISAATFAAITSADGWYDLSLTSSHTDTVGMLTVLVNDDSLILPLQARAMVIAGQVYDSLIGGTDNLDVNVEDWGNQAVPTTESGGQGVVRRNTAQAGAASSITLDASASAVDDFYNGGEIEIIGGTGVGQARRILDYNGTTKVVTVGRNWVTNPDATSVFRIFPSEAPSTVAEIQSGLATSAVLGTPAGASVSADIAAIKVDTAAILVDTDNMQPKLGTPAGASISADIAAMKVDTAAILVDTGTTLDANITAIKAKTDSLTFTQAGHVDANVQRINDVTIVGNGAGTPFNV